jgi:hypothetical protein
MKDGAKSFYESIARRKPLITGTINRGAPDDISVSLFLTAARCLSQYEMYHLMFTIATNNIFKGSNSGIAMIQAACHTVILTVLSILYFNITLIASFSRLPKTTFSMGVILDLQ